MKCQWCNDREVEFELAAYFLKKEKRVVSNNRTNIEQYLRNGKYLSVKLCEKCLPVTSTTNLEKYKLRGK